MRRVDVEEAAAVGAELLDRLLRGHRAHRDRLRDARQRVRVEVSAEALDHALGDEHERADQRDRQEHVEDRAHEVLPEVAEAGAAARDDPPHQRDCDDDPDARREEVLHGQPEHLAEVAHRGLAAVELPVGVRHERRDGVEGDVPRRRMEAQRVEPVRDEEGVLRAQDQIQHEPPHEREHQQALGVGPPVLRAPRIHAKSPVEQALGGRQQRRQKDALAAVQLRHVGAERQRQRGQRDGEQDDREPAAEGHLRASRRGSTRRRGRQ